MRMRANSDYRAFVDFEPGSNDLVCGVDIVTDAGDAFAQLLCHFFRSRGTRSDLLAFRRAAPKN